MKPKFIKQWRRMQVAGGGHGPLPQFFLFFFIILYFFFFKLYKFLNFFQHFYFFK